MTGAADAAEGGSGNKPVSFLFFVELLLRSALYSFSLGIFAYEVIQGVEPFVRGF